MQAERGKRKGGEEEGELPLRSISPPASYEIFPIAMDREDEDMKEEEEEAEVKEEASSPAAAEGHK